MAAVGGLLLHVVTHHAAHDHAAHDHAVHDHVAPEQAGDPLRTLSAGGDSCCASVETEDVDVREIAPAVVVDEPASDCCDTSVSESVGAASSTWLDRFYDLVAVTVGVLILLPSTGHGHGASHGHGVGGMDATAQVVRAFIMLTMETAPALIFGLGVGALLQSLGGKVSLGWLMRGSSFGQAVRGALVGVPIPVCACGVLPIAQSLRQRGGSASLVVAFLIAAPELGVETFALTVQFLGWEFAIARLFAALVLAIIAGVVLAARKAKGEGISQAQLDSDHIVGGEKHQVWHKRFFAHFDNLLSHVGPWTVVGLIVAAYAAVALEQNAVSFSGAHPALQVLAITALAIPSYVCAASATPLAAILVANGLSPGAALTGLLLGPATNVATFGYLRTQFGKRGTRGLLVALLLSAWAMAALGHLTLPNQIPAMDHQHDHGGHSFWAWGMLWTLAVAVGVGIWRHGLGGWFHALLPSDA